MATIIDPEDIIETVKRVIKLPSCERKRPYAIADRIWLEKKIQEYIDTVIAHYETPAGTGQEAEDKK